jgi:hypothetical protein
MSSTPSHAVAEPTYAWDDESTAPRVAVTCKVSYENMMVQWTSQHLPANDPAAQRRFIVYPVYYCQQE